MLLTFALHELGSKDLLGLVLIMGPTSEPEVALGSRAASRDRLDVIELEPRARLAPLAPIAHERAPAAVSFGDGALHVCRNVSGASSSLRGTRLVGRRELALLELGNEQLERAMKHLGHISRRDLMPEQLSRSAQIIVHLLAHRELEREAPRSEWRDPRLRFDARRLNYPRR